MKKATELRKPAAKPARAQASGRRKPPDIVALREIPRWDAVAHELWLGNVLIKRIRRPAQVTELILACFEEQGWPEQIDDPLRPRIGRNEKNRFRHAIDNLNRRLPPRTINFETASHGTAISWRRAR